MVFISYKSEEFDQASAVREALTSQGIACWMAPDSIEPGSEYGNQITDAIRGCDALVLVLSEAAQASMPVLSEVDLASNFGKTIIPFHIDNSPLTDAFLFRLGIFQRIEAAGKLDEAYEDLVARVKDIQVSATQTEPGEDSLITRRQSTKRTQVKRALDEDQAAEKEFKKSLEIPQERSQLTKELTVYGIITLVAYVVFTVMTLYDGAYDHISLYLVIGLALVANNNFDVLFDELATRWKQEGATGLQGFFASPWRATIPFVLTIPLVALVTYADSYWSSRIANNALTAVLMFVQFWDCLELSKLVRARFPRVTRVISQKRACLIMLIASLAITVLGFSQEVGEGLTLARIVGFFGVGFALVTFGGLIALPCNRAVAALRRAMAKRG